MSENKKYKDLISQNPAEVAAKQVDLLVQESKQNVEGDILATNKEIFKVERELEDLKCQKPLNPRLVVEKQQELKALQNGLKALEDLKAELF